MNMRTRHSTGGVRKQRGRWLGLWYEGGVKKSKVLGLVSEMSKGNAREAVAKIVAGLKRETRGTTFRRVRRECLLLLLQPQVERLHAREQREQNFSTSRGTIRRT